MTNLTEPDLLFLVETIATKRGDYALAAGKTSEIALRGVLDTLAEKFILARSALKNLSDRYLRKHGSSLFEEAGSEP